MRAAIAAPLFIAVWAARLAAGEISAPPAQLVLLNIVALDEHDRLVPDLTADDFKVFDNGTRRRIALFRRNQQKPEQFAPPEPAAFDNRSAGMIQHATVILFDLLNENISSRGYAQHELVQALQKLPSGSNLYLYLLTMKGIIYPVRPLPGPEGPPPEASAGWTRDIAPILDRAIRQVFMARPLEMAVDTDYRVRATYTALAALSSALTAIPGRKGIIWITHGIPIAIGPNRSGTGDWIDYSYYLRQFTRQIDQANIVVYPVVMSPRIDSGIASMDPWTNSRT